MDEVPRKGHKKASAFSAWFKLDLHFRHADTAAGRPCHLNHGIWRVFALNWPSQAHGAKEVVSRTVRSVNLTSWVSEPCPVRWLRNGGDVFSLQKVLGHSDLEVTKVYIHLAEVDIENKHRLVSPVDRLGLGRRQSRRSAA